MEVVERKKHLEQIKKMQPTLDEVDLLEIFFKAIADPTRLRILITIASAGKVFDGGDTPGICVLDIAEVVEMSQSAVSHQLRVLRHANLIKKEKHGKNVFYTISDSHVTDIINQSIEHINEKL